MNLEEKQKQSKEIFNGRVVHLFRDTVTLPNGEEGVRELLHHNGAVCVIPVTAQNEIILERQFRYPTGQVLIEIPAGKLDSVAEDPVCAARRELEEETGLNAGKIEPLGIFYPAPAYSSEKIWMYVAKDLTPSHRHLDEDEFLETFSLPFEEALSWVMNGKITDAKTQLALLKLKERGI